MADATLHLEVVTPEGEVYHGDVAMVVLPGVEGELGILARHQPLVTLLGIGETRVKQLDGTYDYIATGVGYAEVLFDRVMVVVDHGELAGRIDVERAEEAARRAARTARAPRRPGRQSRGRLLPRRAGAQAGREPAARGAARGLSRPGGASAAGRGPKAGPVGRPPHRRVAPPAVAAAPARPRYTCGLSDGRVLRTHGAPLGPRRPSTAAATSTLSGAKNSALKLMAASLLTAEPCRIRRAPRINDVDTMAEMLRALGAEVVRTGDELVVTAGAGLSGCAPYELVRTMRASIIVMGPLVARLGEATIAMPGGCNIGPRRIDFHLRGLEKLGATIEIEHGFIRVACDRLRGAVVPLDYPSVGATENLLMAATAADGETVIENAAREPEIVDLCTFLQGMGADIEGAGTQHDPRRGRARRCTASSTRSSPTASRPARSSSWPPPPVAT